VAASLLKPGGRVHLRDVHPMSMVIDPDTDAELRLRYPYGERAMASSKRTRSVRLEADERHQCRHPRNSHSQRRSVASALRREVH
jgi:hypothetical protein